MDRITMPSPPRWGLPQGVNQALWDYAHSTRIAEEEDAYFQNHPLLVTDAKLVNERFTKPGKLADLGCGAGRLALGFASRGFSVVGVDLSLPLLQRMTAKWRDFRDSPDSLSEDALASATEGSRKVMGELSGVRANLCLMGGFAENSFEYALAMFSTLGMIQSAAARRDAVRETYRILQPGGQFALHAHNYWLNLRNSQGRRWLIGQTLAYASPIARLRDPVAERGDRRMTYRGIPNVLVHLFTWRELRTLLTDAGFVIDDVLPLDEITAAPMSRKNPARLQPRPFRAGGWIVFARKPGETMRPA